MKLLVQLKNRIVTMITRAYVKSVNDSGGFQRVNIEMLAGEKKNNVEHLTEYGFTSKAHDGAHAISLSVGGNRDHVVAICLGDKRYRLKNLRDGEVAMYDDLGQSILLGREGVVITSPKVTISSEQVVVDSPEILLGKDATKGVARVGDYITIDTGSSAGSWPIMTSSSAVKSI